jgi:hypothetical protein
MPTPFKPPPLRPAINFGPWADGKFLVVRPESTFPCRCMVCGQPIDRLKEIRLRPPRRLPRRGVAALIGGAAYLAMSTRYSVQYGTCPRHWLRGSCIVWGTALGVLALASGFAGLNLLLSHNGFSLLELIAFVATFVFLGGLIVAFYLQPTIVKVNGPLIWIRAFGKPYLAHLPPLHPGRD